MSEINNLTVNIYRDGFVESSHEVCVYSNSKISRNKSVTFNLSLSSFLLFSSKFFPSKTFSKFNFELFSTVKGLDRSFEDNFITEGMIPNENIKITLAKIV